MTTQQVSHLAAELVAFLAEAAVVWRYGWPPLRAIAEQRQDTLARQVHDSEHAARELHAAQQRYDQILTEAERQAAIIRDDARVDAERIRQTVREQTQSEIDHIRRKGEQQLLARRDHIVRELVAHIARLSLDAARQRLADALTDTASRQRTVDSFLDDLERLAG